MTTPAIDDTAQRRAELRFESALSYGPSEELDAGVRKGTQEVGSDSTSKLVDVAFIDEKENRKPSQPYKSKPESVKRHTNVQNSAATPTVAQENLAIKRQKLEGGKSGQILNVKSQILPHKTILGLASGTSSVCGSAANKAGKEDRKLSRKWEPRQENPIPRNTAPSPFHLHTAERGAEKETRFVTELMQKQLEEERARIPKANPYPYTTDYPVIPPKPEPKHYTKPEPFQLEGLVRHEGEMQREMEARKRKEKEEAQMRIFKARPILKKDPIPLPEMVRNPPTQVQEFKLHVDRRVVDRAEFDQKLKEKEAMYRRYREEMEAAKMIEEERSFVQLRRTRPIPKSDHPFCPLKSSKATAKAKSPNLRVLQRKETRRKAVAMLPAAAVLMDDDPSVSKPCI